MATSKDKQLLKLLRDKKTTKEDIEHKLNVYVSRHDSFSFYAAVDDEEQYKDRKFYLFFGLPNGWEDKQDRSKYVENNSSDTLWFVRCLSYQKSESIAMWHMYGLPNNVRITIKGSTLRKKLGLLNNSKEKLNCYLICKNNQIGKKFTIKSSDIDKFDLMYYSPNNDEYHSYFVQKDSNIVVPKVRNELISQLKNEFYLKHLAFAAEVETRLQIQFKEEFLKKHLPAKAEIKDICGLAVEPNFDSDDIQDIKIVRRPEFLDVRNIKRGDTENNIIMYKESTKFPKKMYAENIVVNPSKLDEDY